jgi:hypothetical protein
VALTMCMAVMKNLALPKEVALGACASVVPAI